MNCDIASTGFTVVVAPENPSLDIVFVHGFTGHPERTWAHKRGDGPHDGAVDRPSKMPKLSRFGTPNQHRTSPQSTTVYWPRDLLPAVVPNARVLTYGYDTRIRHKLDKPVSRNTVYDIAWDFLVALEAERRSDPSKPVLFVVHSLGGIVVKEMLRRSSGCDPVQPHLHDIFQSTVGIVFFGTPHRGADPRGFLQHIAEKLIKAMGFGVNQQIVDTLLPSAERLRELRDEFGPMAEERGWIIHSFQEELGLRALNGRKVVEDTSSCLSCPAVEIAEHIPSDHVDMCRFTGPSDIGYKKVAAALHRITNQNRTRNKGVSIPLSKEQRQVLLDSLRFDQIDARRMTIEKAHAKTCEWYLKTTEYLNWLDHAKVQEHSGFLWVKGKPGTGKSTLMKFTLADSRKRLKDRIIISFFFNARGEVLEKSTTGMYRSLLLQLLEQIPELQCVFDLDPVTGNGGKSHDWSVESLKALFEQAVLMLGRYSLMCFIDALDECDEFQVRDMVSFFEHVSGLAVHAGVQFQVCLSSRHYPHVKMKKGLSLVLEAQEGHSEDITNYVSSKLDIGHSKLAEQIREELQEKASGVFMWVVLVVRILNAEHQRGNMHVLRRRLRDIPSDLRGLFHDILTRDNYGRDELLLSIQWVLFSRQPLTPEQFYAALLSAIDPDFLLDSDEITDDTIKNFMLNSSKGLVEVTRSKIPTVQFIHESVRDFFLKDDGFREIWPNFENGIEGRSHENLKQCCLTYLTRVLPRLHVCEPLPKATSKVAAELRDSTECQFPFLRYAVCSVLSHANFAGSGGVPQGDFIQSFQLADWIKVNNLLEKHEIRRYTTKASLLYILAENNFSALIRALPSNRSYLEVEDERYGPPFFAALATGSYETVEAFLQIDPEGSPSAASFYNMFKGFYQNGRDGRTLGRDFKFTRNRTILSYLLELVKETSSDLLTEIQRLEPSCKDSHNRTLLGLAARDGHAAVVEFLLTQKDVKPDAKDKDGCTPLSLAAEHGYEAVVRLLLAQKGVKPDSSGFGYTPLWVAAKNGHEAVVRLLLAQKGVKPDSRNSGGTSGSTPLNIAVKHGHEAVVKLLLAREDVNPNYSETGYTPLWTAANSGHEAVVRLLLAKKAVNPESKNHLGQTPLSIAAEQGHEGVIRLLLAQEGVDPDSRNSGGTSGGTPLYMAAKHGHETVVRLLLDREDVKLDSKNHLGQTPLSIAAEQGHEGVVRLLLAKGANPDCKDNLRKTPLSTAVEKRHEAIIVLLSNLSKD